MRGRKAWSLDDLAGALVFGAVVAVVAQAIFVTAFLIWSIGQ